jgi:hypothetical protein
MTPIHSFTNRLQAIFLISLFVISSFVAFSPNLSVTIQAQTCPTGQVNVADSCIPCPAEMESSCPGQSCPSFQVIINGACQSCPTNQNPINGVCTAIVCPPNQTAVSGACVPNCPTYSVRNASSGSCICQQNLVSQGSTCLNGGLCSPSGGDRADICHLLSCNNGTNNYPVCTNCPALRAAMNLGLSINICPVEAAIQPIETTAVPNLNTVTKQDVAKTVENVTNKENASKDQQVESNSGQNSTDNSKKSDQGSQKDNKSTSNETNSVSSESQKSIDQMKKPSNSSILLIGIALPVVIVGVLGFFGFRYWKGIKTN